jgi:thioester reductase-like protein
LRIINSKSYVFQAFDNIRQNHPDFLSKVIPVSGDISRDELGISPQDLQMMSETVSIAFHSAAIVRFDEPLKSAIELNVKGVKRMISICKKLENLEVRRFVIFLSLLYLCSTPILMNSWLENFQVR